ncbi:MAG: 30S ribosomal protein S6 [Alphaproteobacteria bacterium]|nr:30S ribosomal protein S6 [Alphaproteobacteria bacterium]
MPFYETVFIARQDLTDGQVKALTEQFSKIITDGKGKIHKTEFWGLRSFAYKINKARKGHYVLLELDTEAPALLEMERQMRLHEDVVRYLTIREEELSDGPSIVMDKSARDDDRKDDDKYSKEAA